MTPESTPGSPAPCSEVGSPVADLQQESEDRMTTQQTIEAYFHALGSGKGWEALLAEDLQFTSFTSPVKTIAGKEAFLEGT